MIAATAPFKRSYHTQITLVSHNSTCKLFCFIEFDVPAAPEAKTVAVVGVGSRVPHKHWQFPDGAEAMWYGALVAATTTELLIITNVIELKWCRRGRTLLWGMHAGQWKSFVVVSALFWCLPLPLPFVIFAKFCWCCWEWAESCAAVMALCGLFTVSSFEFMSDGDGD